MIIFLAPDTILKMHRLILACLLAISICKADTDRPIVEVSEGLLKFVNRSLLAPPQRECLMNLPRGLESVGFLDEASLLKYKQNKSIIRREISEQEADKIFKFIKEQPMISYDSSRGCYARAYLASLLLELNGYSSQRLFLVAGENNSLDTTTTKGTPVSWRYHAVTTLSVRTRKGSLETWVFDPSTTNNPELVHKWVKRLSKKSCRPVPYPRKEDKEPEGCYYYKATQFTLDVLEDERKYWHSDDIQDALNENSDQSLIAAKIELQKLREKKK